jgi:hypothetical protein
MNKHAIISCLQALPLCLLPAAAAAHAGGHCTI